MNLDSVYRFLIFAQSPQANPPPPEAPDAGAQTILGLGVAGFWLLAIMAVLIGLVLMIPKLFRSPRPTTRP